MVDASATPPTAAIAAAIAVRRERENERWKSSNWRPSKVITPGIVRRKRDVAHLYQALIVDSITQQGAGHEKSPDAIAAPPAPRNTTAATTARPRTAPPARPARPLRTLPRKGQHWHAVQYVSDVPRFNWDTSFHKFLHQLHVRFCNVCVERDVAKAVDITRQFQRPFVQNRDVLAAEQPYQHA